MVIDAHVHVFDIVRGRIAQGLTSSGSWGAVDCAGKEVRVFPPFNPKTEFLPEALIRYMDIEGIDKAILMQGCFYGNQNELAKQAVKSYPHRLAAAMYLEPFAEDAMERFEQNAERFKAVKLECSEATGFTSWGMDLDIAEYIPLYREMSKRNMVLVLDLGRPGTKGYMTGSVKKIIDAVPELKIVICHLAQPGISDGEMLVHVWKEQLELANHGRVWFDTASLAAYFSSEVYPYQTGARLFDTALNIVSPSRIMAGTDMPGNSLVASYKQMLFLPRLYGSVLGLNDMELAAIMGKNAQKVYFE